MIALGDEENRGYVDLDGFMKLMHQIGLIKKEQPDKMISDIDKEY